MIKNLIKSVEFLVVVGLSLLGFLFGAIPLLWFIVIAGGYILVNLMGWANRSIGGDNKSSQNRTVNPNPPNPPKDPPNG